MKNLLADTNIYGELVIDVQLGQIKDNLEKQSSVMIFGSPIVRTELRATPKKIKVSGRNLRIDLLSLYDILTHNRVLPVTNETEKIADSYYEAYRKLGGAKGKKELWNDFLLVASASLKNMNIVVSEDEATMQAEYSLQAYALINSARKLASPQFINYKQLKELIR